MFSEPKYVERAPVLYQLIIYWITLTILLFVFAIGGDTLGAYLFIPAYVNAVMTFGACTERLQECRETIAALEWLRSTPRCGTVWTQKGDVL